MSGGKDGQTLFHRIILATARGLMNKTAVNWHLKFKDIEYNVGLTKNCCIKVSMQKISSIHKLIQQIIRSHELNGHAHLVITSTQKSLKLLLAFLNLHQHAKNQFIPSVYSKDTVNFRVLWPGWPHPSLTTPTRKNFWLTFNLCEFVSTCKN